jgi:hypothetical protein
MVRDMESDMHAAKRRAYLSNEECRATFSTVTLHDLLLQMRAPRDIDYISIDTEGSEFEILINFPFDEWRVRAFTIEHNFGRQRERIRELMVANGYSVTDAQWDDWFWKDY